MADARQPWLSWLLVLHLVNFLFPTNSDLPQKQVLAPRQLFSFQAYKDVQLFHYVIPEQTTSGTWEFVANCTHLCNGQIEVTVSLQHGSYPVVQIGSNRNPSNLATSRQSIQILKLRPNNQKSANLNVASPMPGDWFAAAFYTLINKRRAERKWLPVRCEVWLSSTASFYVDSSVLPLVPGYPTMQRLSRTQRYRYYATEGTWSARLMLTECDPCPVWLLADARVPPSANVSNRIDCRTLHRRGNTPCTLEISSVVENGWNYVQVELHGYEDDVRFRIEIRTTICPNHNAENTDFLKTISPEAIAIRKDSKSSRSPSRKQIGHRENLKEQICYPRLPLIRQKLPGNFAFRYGRPAGISEFPPQVNISNFAPTLTVFEIMPIVDIGGTFTVEIMFPPKTDTEQHIIALTACLRYNQRPHITSDGMCRVGFGMYLNSSIPKRHQGKLMVPFPEAGRWYLLLKPKCYQQGDNDEKLIAEAPCHSNTTSLTLRLESGPCILGQCGDYGHCYQYLSGGLVFSSCLCTAGRKGWGCTDDSVAHTYSQLLTALLLLTLSNILFLPVIVLAIYRRFFTEALVYFAATVFSALFHACDFEVSPFCIMRLSVLQYCDVYSSVLSIWLTLVALADLPTSGRSVCHMAGALGLALGVEYDRTGLWVFVVPVGAGVALISISWVIHCYYQRHCYPRKRTWLQLLVGFFLLGSGLVLFAMLEGHRNYAFIHSGRHACLGLASLCLLPCRRHSKGRQEGINTCSYIRVEELSDISHPLECGVYQHLLTPSP